MKIVKIRRKQQDENQSLGFIEVTGEKNEPIYADISLERGWRNNERNVSCIPKGMYTLKKEFSPKFTEMLWEIYGVEGRSECKIHPANRWKELNGCMAPGISVKDIDGDGYLDVTSSRASLERFHAAMGDDTEAMLIVMNDFPKECENLCDR